MLNNSDLIESKYISDLFGIVHSRIIRIIESLLDAELINEKDLDEYIFRNKNNREYRGYVFDLKVAILIIDRLRVGYNIKKRIWNNLLHSRGRKL